jgi:hypothetical protein
MRVRVADGRLVEVGGRIFVGGQSLEVTAEQARPLLATGAVKRQRNADERASGSPRKP